MHGRDTRFFQINSLQINQSQCCELLAIQLHDVIFVEHQHLNFRAQRCWNRRQLERITNHLKNGRQKEENDEPNYYFELFSLFPVRISIFSSIPHTTMMDGIFSKFHKMIDSYRFFAIGPLACTIRWTTERPIITGRLRCHEQ